MDGERIIFADEASPGRYLKVVASGEMDQSLVEGLEHFTARLKKRLGLVPSQEKTVAEATTSTGANAGEAAD